MIWQQTDPYQTYYFSLSEFFITLYQWRGSQMLFSPFTVTRSPLKWEEKGTTLCSFNTTGLLLYWLQPFEKQFCWVSNCKNNLKKLLVFTRRVDLICTGTYTLKFHSMWTCQHFSEDLQIFRRARTLDGPRWEVRFKRGPSMFLFLFTVKIFAS